MKNTTKKGVIHLLILKSEENKYTGMCKEFGFIEEGDDETEVINRLVNSCKLLLKTVTEHSELEPSLNVGLPYSYRFLYYISIIKGTLFNMYINLQTRNLSQLRYA